MSSKDVMDSFKPGAESRPIKRRRMEMPTPDGFTSNTPPKPVYKASVPRFSSAFNDNDNTPAKRPREVPETPVAMKDSSRRVEANVSLIHKPRETREKLLVSVQEMHKDFSRETSTKQKVTLQLRPPPRPPLPPVVASASNSTPLRQIVKPKFSSAKPTSKGLQPLQPPPNLMPTTRSNLATGKDMRTISTTGLGLLNDLSHDKRTEELASILLRDQHPEIHAHESAADSIMRRGLELSPEKKGKGNSAKFIRGGLAARASAHFDRSHTALILWQKEVEHRSNALPPSDICASIVKVLHKPLVASFKSTAASPVIALCRLHQPNGTAHTLFNHDHLYRMVFSVSNTHTTPNTAERFTEGQMVRIFKPWQEISFSLEPGPIDQSEPQVLPRLPASLPLPCSEPLSTPDPLDAPIHDKALFCSRFLIS
ncbi:hypothetical protein BDZ97DRAFT_1828044 [Flammula alnicola]|nr:hypothetical protein BDZ97DRAFT_1828044 [Flammula alnicola]